MTQARFDLDDYTVKVLDVFKGRHGLKNRNEALNKFVHDHGEDYAEFRIGPKTAREIIETFNEMKNEPNMSDRELRKLLGIEDVEIQGLKKAPKEAIGTRKEK